MIDFSVSSFCTGGGCVAVGRTCESGVAVRDTKVRDGAVLVFTAEEWVAFVAGAKNGEFDLV